MFSITPPDRRISYPAFILAKTASRAQQKEPSRDISFDLFRKQQMKVDWSY
jgi:hypothetical protein